MCDVVHMTKDFCEWCGGDGNEPCADCVYNPDDNCGNERHDEDYMPEPCSECGGTGEEGLEQCEECDKWVPRETTRSPGNSGMSFCEACAGL